MFGIMLNGQVMCGWNDKCRKWQINPHSNKIVFVHVPVKIHPWVFESSKNNEYENIMIIII